MQVSLKLLALMLLILSVAQCGLIRSTRGFDSCITMLRDRMQDPSADAILFWNSVMLQACGNDYDKTLVPSPDQVGPTATSRAFAIIHGAMFEAMKAISQSWRYNYGFGNIFGRGKGTTQISMLAAITEAAYQTLIATYPQQIIVFDAVRTAYLQQLRSNVGSNNAINNGINIGRSKALAILKNRANDNSQINADYRPVPSSGYHQVDPMNPTQGFLGVRWGEVRPFIIKSGSQFRASNVVGERISDRLKFLNSAKHIQDFIEVKSYGAKYSKTRTPDQTEIGNFWAYDGSPKLGVPPRLYNQIVRVIAIQKKNTMEDNALLFAMVNYALADAGIAGWESKYYYSLWRPVVGIRQAVNRALRDPNWEPLGSPSNNGDNNFTPSFPSYVSGHSIFGSSVFQVLRLFYKTDNIPFSFQSDEYNGSTYDSVTGQVRSARTRRYQTFTQAETENFLSRIYLGVHWRIDQEEGRVMGRSIGSYVYNKLSGRNYDFGFFK